MDRGNFSVRDYHILSSLSNIPKKIVTLHGTENLSEFVLHELSRPQCFNLPRVAYFVDNPDFNYCKGVAGCCTKEEYGANSCKWEAPEKFSDHMKQSSFNKKVRQINNVSSKNKYDEVVRSIAQQLDIKNPHYHVFDLKNNNKGLLVYEHNPQNEAEISKHLQQGTALLSFCPVF